MMANYGRGWGDGYESQSTESVEAHWDREAKAEGDHAWLDRSPRQKRLQSEQGLTAGEYADEKQEGGK